MKLIIPFLAPDGSARDFYITKCWSVHGNIFVGAPRISSITPDQAREFADALHDFADILEN